MRFLVVVVLPAGQVSDVQEAVARLVAPYDLNAPAPPYKKYLSQRAVTGHAARFGLDAHDLAAVAAHMNAHYLATLRLTTHFQADATGIYVMADTNPDGKYKRWAINDRAADVWRVSEMPRDLVPHAVVTPDGQWHELFPRIWGKIPTAQDEQRLTQEAYALMDRYPDHLAVRLECHF